MTLRTEEIRKRKILSDVALGSIAPDTILTHGTVFNSFTGEFIKDQSIWIKHGRIAYVGPDHDPPTAEQNPSMPVGWFFSRD
jgi:adenine deaminase